MRLRMIRIIIIVCALVSASASSQQKTDKSHPTIQFTQDARAPTKLRPKARGQIAKWAESGFESAFWNEDAPYSLVFAHSDMNHQDRSVDIVVKGALMQFLKQVLLNTQKYGSKDVWNGTIKAYAAAGLDLPKGIDYRKKFIQARSISSTAPLKSKDEKKILSGIEFLIPQFENTDLTANEDRSLEEGPQDKVLESLKVLDPLNQRVAEFKKNLFLQQAKSFFDADFAAETNAYYYLELPWLSLLEYWEYSGKGDGASGWREKARYNIPVWFRPIWADPTILPTKIKEATEMPCDQPSLSPMRPLNLRIKPKPTGLTPAQMKVRQYETDKSRKNSEKLMPVAAPKKEDKITPHTPCEKVFDSDKKRASVFKVILKLLENGPKALNSDGVSVQRQTKLPEFSTAPLCSFDLNGEMDTESVAQKIVQTAPNKFTSYRINASQKNKKFEDYFVLKDVKNARFRFDSTVVIEGKKKTRITKNVDNLGDAILVQVDQKYYALVNISKDGKPYAISVFSELLPTKD